MVKVSLVLFPFFLGSLKLDWLKKNQNLRQNLIICQKANETQITET